MTSAFSFNCNADFQNFCFPFFFSDSAFAEFYGSMRIMNIEILILFYTLPTEWYQWSKSAQ